MSDDLLTRTVSAFNARRFDDAAKLAAQGMSEAVGRDELFWMGLHETASGFALLMAKQPAQGEKLMMAAMERLRVFGYRYQNVEVTSVLAGLRRGIEELRAVAAGHKRMFDTTLLPQIKLTGRAQEL